MSSSPLTQKLEYNCDDPWKFWFHSCFSIQNDKLWVYVQWSCYQDILIKTIPFPQIDQRAREKYPLAPKSSTPNPDNMCAAKLLQLCPALCDPMDHSRPGSSVHGILQARMLEWVAISFPRGPSQPRDWIQVSCMAGRFFTIGANSV